MLYQGKEWSSQAGLSLLSLLISLTIVSVLGALSVPSFMQFIQRSDMHEARNRLVMWQAEQIRFRLGNGKYANIEELSAQSVADYVFSVSEVTETGYMLRAKRTMELKDGCDELTVTGTGEYLPTDCWH